MIRVADALGESSRRAGAGCRCCENATWHWNTRIQGTKRDVKLAGIRKVAGWQNAAIIVFGPVRTIRADRRPGLIVTGRALNTSEQLVRLRWCCKRSRLFHGGSTRLYAPRRRLDQCVPREVSQRAANPSGGEFWLACDAFCDQLFVDPYPSSSYP